MKRFLYGILYSALIAIIEFFLAMQLAYFASFNHNFEAYMKAKRICWDPKILYWQGNNRFFNEIMFLIAITVFCTLLSSLFRTSKGDKTRQEKQRGMTSEEMKDYTHIATLSEAKKGLVRLHFDYKGQLDHTYFYKNNCYADIRWWIGMIGLIIQFSSLFILMVHGIQWMMQFFMPAYHLALAIGTVPQHISIEIFILMIECLLSTKLVQPEAWRELKKYHQLDISNDVSIWKEYIRMLIPHFRDYLDYVLNPIRHLHNRTMVFLRQPDEKKVNELKTYHVDHEAVTRRTGVPVLTWRRGVWVDPENNHSLIIGTTNSGKTVSVIKIMIELARMCGHSMIVNDLKGELSQQHKANLEKDGYNVLVLDFLNPQEGVMWNPFGLVIKRYREAQQKMMDGFASHQQKEAYIMKKIKLMKLNKELSDLHEIRDSLDRREKGVLDERIYKKEWEIELLKESLVQEILSDSFPKPDFSEAFELLDDITRALCEEKDSRQPFFWQQAKALLSGIICFLLEYEYIDANGNLCHLDDNQINFQNINLLKEEGFNWVHVNGKNHLLLKYYLDYYRLKIDKSRNFLETLTTESCAAETRSNVFQTFDNHMALGTLNEKIGNMMSRTSFDFSMIAKEKTAMFLVVHDEKQTYYPFVTLFVSQFYNEVVKTSREFEHQLLPIPVDILWDEFGISPPLHDPDNMFSASRFRGVRWNLVIQDYSQLDKNYSKEVARAIRNNMMNTIYLLGGDPDTLDFVSRMCGKKLKWNKEKGNFDTVPTISPDRLRRLSLSEAVVIRQRKNPIITRYTPYFKYVFYKNKSKKKSENKVKGVKVNKANYKIFSLKDEFNHRGDRLEKLFGQDIGTGMMMENCQSVLEQLNQQRIDEAGSQ